MARTRVSLDPSTRRRLAAASDVTDQTICRYLRGSPVSPTTQARLERAAGAIGVALPRPPAPTGEGASQ